MFDALSKKKPRNLRLLHELTFKLLLSVVINRSRQQQRRAVYITLYITIYYCAFTRYPKITWPLDHNHFYCKGGIFQNIQGISLFFFLMSGSKDGNKHLEKPTQHFGRNLRYILQTRGNKKHGKNETRK